MTRQVAILPSALRQLAALPQPDQRRIRRKIDALASEPRPTGAKRLQSEHELLRLRCGNYRIIYTIERDRPMVLVVKIGHRREVYRGI
ncbi:MAG TPA: type II toxin-antitoxin system RelE/ParE family toxin [Terriglobia bacterium]|nr:type II toxin-antitoxin system RelE/ParE family toxin [Terriglobia bacterium]